PHARSRICPLWTVAGPPLRNGAGAGCARRRSRGLEVSRGPALGPDQQAEVSRGPALGPDQQAEVSRGPALGPDQQAEVSLFVAQLVDGVSDVPVVGRQVPEHHVALDQRRGVQRYAVGPQYPYVPVVLDDRVDGTPVGRDRVDGQQRPALDLRTPDR